MNRTFTQFRQFIECLTRALPWDFCSDFWILLKLDLGDTCYQIADRETGTLKSQIRSSRCGNWWYNALPMMTKQPRMDPSPVWSSTGPRAHGPGPRALHGPSTDPPRAHGPTGPSRTFHGPLQKVPFTKNKTPVLLRTTKYYTPALLCYSGTTKYYSSTTKYYSSTTPATTLCTTKYYSSTTPVLQSNTPVLLRYYKVLLRYYKVLLRYYKVIPESSPVLLCTTKYYSSTTPVLQSNTPVLLRYYKVLLRYYKVLLQYYSGTTK